MNRWLFNSDGDPIAFISNVSVYSARGDFIGKLYDDNTVWNGEYIGEIYQDDRFVFDERKLRPARGIPGIPGLPSFVREPDFKGPISLPLGLKDVNIR
jgi:hypothetical protein